MAIQGSKRAFTVVYLQLVGPYFGWLCALANLHQTHIPTVTAPST